MALFWLTSLSTSGLADWGGALLIRRGDGRCALSIGGVALLSLPGLCQDTGEESQEDWTSSRIFEGVFLTSLPVLSGLSCGVVLREYGMSGVLLRE